jgi:hypothetical protein
VHLDDPSHFVFGSVFPGEGGEVMSAGTDEQTIQARFETWIERHPDVYQEFKRIAESLLAHRRTHYGAKAIMEVLRYHRIVSGADETEPFKINNNYSSRIARKLMDEDERFVGFFETRELKTK